jgi:ABC-type nitrate/sulfonate/bicarbonate transport system permease component
MKTEQIKLSDALITVALICLGGILWEGFVKWQEIPAYILPSPSKIINTLITNASIYSYAGLLTLGEAITGLILGTIMGVAAASLLGLWPRLEQAIMTLAILIKSTPLVAIAPLLTIWLGFGILPKVIITALLTFFPVLVNVLTGLRAADPAFLETFHSWNANRRDIYWHIRVPHAVPYLFAALKVSGPLALIGSVVAEWTGASGGLGRIMWLAYANLNLPYLFAAVFILAAFGVLLFSTITWAENKVVFWEKREQ